MPRRPSATRRLLIPLVLATVLAGEVAGLAAAAALDGRTAASAAGPTGPAPAVGIAAAGRARPAAESAVSTDAMSRGHGAAPSRRSVPASVLAARGTATDNLRPTRSHAAAPRPPLVAEARAVSKGPGVRQGRNHLWIPNLGVSRSVESFPCSRTRPPDNFIYRWGCAGRNNVYFLGHAYSVFKPLHDAYVGGRLRQGMTAAYADGNGRVRTYAVAWWKITRPTAAAAWAWAAQSTPSMTLQTCVGANSEYRLIVRLVATN